MQTRVNVLTGLTLVVMGLVVIGSLGGRMDLALTAGALGVGTAAVLYLRRPLRVPAGSQGPPAWATALREQALRLEAAVAVIQEAQGREVERQMAGADTRDRAPELEAREAELQAQVLRLVASVEKLESVAKTLKPAWDDSRLGTRLADLQSRVEAAQAEVTMAASSMTDAIEVLDRRTRPGRPAMVPTATPPWSSRDSTPAERATASVTLDRKRGEAVLNELSRLSYIIPGEVEAAEQLMRRYQPEGLVPVMGGWSMAASDVMRICRGIEAQRPNVVLECGSGASSVWIALALQRVGHGRLVSLEHQGQHGEQVRKSLQDCQLTTIAEIRCSDLEVARIGKASYDWYAQLTWNDLTDIDLLIVDGPPKATGEHARYPALPLLHRQLRSGARVVLDDAGRPEEKAILDRWLAEFQRLERTRDTAASGHQQASFRWNDHA